MNPLLRELSDAVLLVLLDGELISDLLESFDNIVTAVLIDVLSALSEFFDSLGFVNGFRNCSVMEFKFLSTSASPI